MSTSRRRDRSGTWQLVGDTVRSHRVAALAWVVGGGLFMYAIGASIAEQMSTYPGGPAALARSVLPSVEAMRPLRWPAEHLDTLGGYLTFHNVTLYSFTLSLYATIQGARAVRAGEEHHSVEVILATGWSRWRLVRDRAAGFAVVLAVVTVGVGASVAATMATGGEPELGGSFITVTAAGLAAGVAYALGMLVSQLVGSSRTAGGVSALLVTVLYIGTNVWDTLGPLQGLRFVSPFYYANRSYALVPGHGFDAAATIATLLLAAALLAAAGWAYEHRDYGAALGRHRVPAGPPSPRRRPWAVPVVLRRPWTAILARGRVALLVWTLASAAVTALWMWMQPAVLDLWDVFADLLATTSDASPEAQYLAFAGQTLVFVVAAYVVAQASGWLSDLSQGRVEVVLATPVTWTRLVWERLLALVVGVAVVTTGALATLAGGALLVGSAVDVGGLVRVGALCVLSGAALGGVAAVLVAWLRSGLAVIGLAGYLAAAYTVTYLVALAGWPQWLERLSVLWAFGDPYLAWPPASALTALTVLAVGGGWLAALLAERTPKVG